MKPIHFVLLSTGLLAACAHSGANYTPILDGPQTASYQRNLSGCQALARDQRQFDRQTMATAALGAGAGALLASADGGDAAGGAVVGVLAGGTAGAVKASKRRKAIVVKCMRGRGHRVVG